tara:strand:- start:48 stop:437 length:390 start_codon:yes stop_codon:yes gene_type:complete
VDIKINPLQPKRVPKPVRREPAGPTLYNVVSLVPLELESNEGVSVIDQGSTLCNVTILHGIDPDLVTKQLGTDVQVVEGQLICKRSRKYEGDWRNAGDVLGTVDNVNPNLGAEWILSTVGKFSEYEVAE